MKCYGKKLNASWQEPTQQNCCAWQPCRSSLVKAFCPLPAGQFRAGHLGGDIIFPDHSNKPAHEESTKKKKTSDERSWDSKKKTREGCGCPKFFAGRFPWLISTLLESSSLIFRQHVLLSLPRFGHLSGKENGCWQWAVPSGMLLDFLLRDRHSLLELFWSKPFFRANFVLQKCGSKELQDKRHLHNTCWISGN